MRTDITKKIEAAREEGDLKENGGYHAAKDDQGKNEARIRQLKHMFENAKVRTPRRRTRQGDARHNRHGEVRRRRYRDVPAGFARKQRIPTSTCIHQPHR